MTITPDEARALIDGATPGPWVPVHDSGHGGEWHSHVNAEDGARLTTYDSGYGDADIHAPDADLMAAAPDLAQTIAGMKWQTGVHAGDEDIWAETPEEEALAIMAAKRPDVRLIRRLVSTPEVVEEA